MQYLLDTDTCIAAMKSNSHVVAKMSTTSPGDLAVSTIAIHELFTGVQKCAQPLREQAKVELLLAAVHTCDFTDAAAKASARVRAALEAAGTPIGPYDILLAGQALALGVVLVTSNTREYSRVSGLSIEDWQV